MKSASGVLLGLLVSMTPALHAEEDASPTVEETEGAAKKNKERQFYTLPLCWRAEGGLVQVLRPGKSEWEQIEEGKFYPLGCSYRTMDEKAHLELQFGKDSQVEMTGKSSFGTLFQPVGRDDRTIMLKDGTITVKLPRNTKQGTFKVAATGFTVCDLAGEAECTYSGTGDGDVATIKCVTGAMAVKGQHFSISGMNAADEVKIRTSQDALFTGIYGLCGDCDVKLDQGVAQVTDVTDGSVTTEEKTLTWRLSPKTAIRIHRAVPMIGERMSVTVMTFGAEGQLMNRCTFAEGLALLNTGEQGDGAIAAKEAEAKKAAQGADEVTQEVVSDEELSAGSESTAETVTETEKTEDKSEETTVESIIEE